MTTPWVVLSTLLTTLGLIAVAWVTAKGNRKQVAIEGATPAYTDMDSRMRYVENELRAHRAEIDTLRAERDIDRGHIIEVHWWDRTGREGDLPPGPEWYQERFPNLKEGIDG